MWHVFEVLLIISTAVLSSLAMFLLVQALASQRYREIKANLLADVAVRVLIPAHNEEAGLGDTIKLLLHEVRSASEILVVADNCTDLTAAVALDLGASVLIRNDSVRIGKGYALQAGIESFKGSPPEVVVFVDADCKAARGTVAALAKLAVVTGVPVQGVNTVALPAAPTQRDRISAFAFAFKNVVRARGMAAMNLPCPLMGTGMAIPYSVLERADLATGSLAEDMELGLALGRIGAYPRFCSLAHVTSDMPTTSGAALKQRGRWEHGHLHVALFVAPKSLVFGLLQLRFKQVFQALDHCVPPLALFALLLGAVLLTSGLFVLNGGHIAVLIIALLGCLAFVLSLAIGWSCEGYKYLSIKDLLSIPAYILWKLPLYLKFASAKVVKWERTSREE